MASFHLCDTEETLQQAIKAVSKTPIVYVDCEGDDLGQSENSLAIISLGVFEPQPDDPEWSLSIFLVDVLAFKGDKAEHIAPIFDMLQSKDIVKVVFDGRMDACEFLHGHNVTLRRVVDLQIADVTSRERRGEDIEMHLERLRSSLPPREIEENGYLFTSVHRLNGLVSALIEHGIETGPKISKPRFPWTSCPKGHRNTSSVDTWLTLSCRS
jgi:exonuclease 3'-5' domain-containing protein 1